MTLVNKEKILYKSIIFLCFFHFSLTAMARNSSFDINTLDSVTRKTLARKIASLYEKLVGIPLSNFENKKLKEDLMSILYHAENEQEGLREVALYIINNESKFYLYTLWQFVNPWVNQGGISLIDFNDTTASIIGAIRDSDKKPFNRILFEDFVYVVKILRKDGSGSLTANLTRAYTPFGSNRGDHHLGHGRMLMTQDEEGGLNELYETSQTAPLDTQILANIGIEIPYKYIEEETNHLRTGSPNRNIDQIKAIFNTQTPDGITHNGGPSMLRKNNGVEFNGAAGIITTDQFAREFFFAGTNRRVTRYLFKNFLCHDFEELHDVNTPDIYVGKDVPREIGGKSTIYKQSCVGCHAGQDALRGAMAYYDYNNSYGLVYTPPQTQRFYNNSFGNPGVRTKYIRNNVVFPNGHEVVDDTWENLWATGKNQKLGWRGPIKGRGLVSLGNMLANSEAFSSCMAKKTFDYFCYSSTQGSVLNEQELVFIQELAQKFESNYNFKELIADVTVHCFQGIK